MHPDFRASYDAAHTTSDSRAMRRQPACAELRIVALFYGRIERVISTWMIFAKFHLADYSSLQWEDASVRPQPMVGIKKRCTTC